MELQPIGRAPDADQLDLEPIIVPVVGYKEDKTEVVEKFPFKPVMPPAVMSAVARNAGPDGKVPANIVQGALISCIDADSKERWAAFLDSEDTFILQETLDQVLNALTEVYSKRPTRQRSGSAGTGTPAAPTLPAAAPLPDSISTE